MIMKKYGIPSKWIAIVKALFKDFQCVVIDKGETTEWFPVVTRVKQGCCMSGFLFIMKIDWVVRQTVENKKTGIRWNFTVLEDLDFADDIALLSSTFDQLQTKTTRLEENPGRGRAQTECTKVQGDEVEQQGGGCIASRAEWCGGGGALPIPWCGRDP